MQPFVCLQAGHENAKNNCDPALRGGTGAPGEVEFTVRIRNRLSQILISKGIMVKLVDACYNCDKNVGLQDYSLFLAIHYDSDVYNAPGGFVDYPDPSVDASNVESKRIRDAIAGQYFPNAGIENHPERSNANTKFYYMWRALSAKTPCVIVECGVGQNAHDKVILADTERVASALARGICKAFNIPYDTPPAPQPPQPPEPDYKTMYEQSEQRNKTLSENLAAANKKLNDIKAIIG